MASENKHGKVLKDKPTKKKPQRIIHRVSKSGILKPKVPFHRLHLAADPCSFLSIYLGLQIKSGEL